MKSLEDRIRGCFLAGAFGDACGTAYESDLAGVKVLTGSPRMTCISDDTQLTLATCESLLDRGVVDPADLASRFLCWYQQGRLTGLGASTLKAMRDLQVGAPWYLAGSRGERTAGNGAAMRIAPFGFWLQSDDPTALMTLRDVCSITHRNDEAFVGAWAIVEAIWHLIDGGSPEEMLATVAQRLPDTRVRERLEALSSIQTDEIHEVAVRYGSSGYVADSIPFAMFAAAKVRQKEIEEIIKDVIRAGGDTDTNASLCGQLAGTVVGSSDRMVSKLKQLCEFPLIDRTIESLAKACVARRAA